MFEIQVWHRGQWQNTLVSDYSEDNRFATVADAEAAMHTLLAEGDPRDSDRSKGFVEYRVVEVKEPKQCNTI